MWEQEPRLQVQLLDQLVYQLHQQLLLEHQQIWQ
jgi:hypothetical protein